MDDLEVWTAEWAGGVSGLITLTSDVRSEAITRQRAVKCLKLIAEDRPDALDNLPDDLAKAQVAWFCVPSRWSLEYLARSPAQHDLMLFPLGCRSSRLATLLDYADQSARDLGPRAVRDLELCLDILLPYTSKALYSPYLADRIPRLIVVSRMRGSQRCIQLHPDSADRVVQSLLLRADDVVAGRSTHDQVVELLKPWMTVIDQDSPAGKALRGNARLAGVLSPNQSDRGIDSPRDTRLAPTALPSKTTAAELVAIVAPTLHKSLASAPAPPLGIAPTVIAASPDALNQASAWAGKVYSQHQFRTRDNVGLGITAPGPVSRPASKHVDEWHQR